MGRRGDGVGLKVLAFLVAKPVSTNSNHASTTVEVPTGDRRTSGGEFEHIWMKPPDSSGRGGLSRAPDKLWSEGGYLSGPTLAINTAISSLEIVVN